ncbi:MAG: hypothetical protein HZC01_05285 [Candidatus Kerfeldbacteria bacterium]|nr:hypothetical protein [Candidatus Kerfeldbacteria bacterium]
MDWSRRFNTQTYTSSGFSIIESVVTIGLTSILIILFGATYTATTTDRYLHHRSLAYIAAAEELEIIRNTDFDTLDTRTNAPFIGVAYTQGTWTVETLASPPSGTHVLTVVPNASYTPASQIFIPEFGYKNFDFSSSFMVNNSSGNGWSVYYFYRYQDPQNYYSLNITSTQAVLEKKVAGVTSQLGTTSHVFSKNSWYTLAASVTDGTFTITLDGSPLVTGTDAQNELTKGKLGFGGNAQTRMYFDSVSITGLNTHSYNFDSDTSGSLPDQWQRYGVPQLPSAAGLLTISHPDPLFDDLKAVTAQVTWSERGATKSVELSTLISP